MAELKQCPFCNGDARIYGGEELYWVKCLNHAEGCCVDGPTRKTIQEAIDAWNRREK